MSKADIVNGWYRERLSSGPIAQHTPAYNQLVDALSDLIARLDAAEDPAASEPAPAAAKAAKASKAAAAADAPPPDAPAPEAPTA